MEDDELDSVDETDVDDVDEPEMGEDFEESDLEDAELDDEPLDDEGVDDDFAGAEEIESIEDLEDAELADDEDSAALLLGDLEQDAVLSSSDEEELDGLRDGEFVCRSCYMAKRESALADPKRMLCRDCA